MMRKLFFLRLTGSLLLSSFFWTVSATHQLTDEMFDKTEIVVSQPLSSRNFEDLIKHLGEGSKIEKVHLSAVSLASVPEDIFYKLGKQLCKNKALSSLTLEKCDLHDYAAAKICWALKSNKEFPLETLNLSHNALYNRIGHSLGEALELNKSLKELFLDNIKLGDDGITLIASVLAKNSTLILLSLSDNDIQGRGAAKLGSALALNTTLKNLNLAHNKIEVDGFNLLSFGLSRNTSLHTLDLAFNKLEETQEEFSRLQHLSLQELRIGGNNLSIESLENLASSLGKNTSLTGLSLAHSGLNEDNFDKFIELPLPSENNLKFLDLSFNALAEGAVFTLSSYLDDTRHLTSLDLSYNQITDAGLDDLIEALKKQKNVASLILAHNEEISSEKLSVLDKLLQNLAKSSKVSALSFVKQPIVINQISSTQIINTGNF